MSTTISTFDRLDEQLPLDAPQRTRYDTEAHPNSLPRRSVAGKRAFVSLTIVLLLLTQLACSSLAASSRCTLGVQSTQTTITYEGPGAQAACDQVKQNQQFVTTPQEPTSIPIVCDVTRGPIHIRVRDNSDLKTVANQMCQSIQQGLLPL
jgi:hypothetical protein